MGCVGCGGAGAREGGAVAGRTGVRGSAGAVGRVGRAVWYRASVALWSVVVWFVGSVVIVGTVVHTGVNIGVRL